MFPGGFFPNTYYTHFYWPGGAGKAGGSGQTDIVYAHPHLYSARASAGMIGLR